MAIGNRIRFFRKRKGLTQKQLGEMLGFMGKTSDVRMAQYEAEARTPKANLISAMASIFGVSPRSISVPDIDSYTGLMHTLFALEDMYGITITKLDGELCLHLDKFFGSDYLTLFDYFEAWNEQADRLRSGESTKEEYDKWRYNYPASNSHNIRAKIPDL